MPPRLADMSADLDALYRAPFSEFITQRNALATRVRDEQGKDAAAAIKALAKPSGTAWVVNQLFWRHRPDFDRLMKAGDQLRAVQQQRLAGQDDADMRKAADARQSALSALMARVPELLTEAGLSATSQDMRTRVSTTLEALSIYGGREPGPRAGRLTEDVDPPGFAALAMLVPAVPESRARSASGAAARESASAKAQKGAAAAETEAEDEAETEDPRSGKKVAAAKGHGATATAESPAPAKLRAVDIKRVSHAKAALDDAEQAVEDARAVAKATETARQRAETRWQDAKDALDEAQAQLDAAMDRERAMQEARDAARKAATEARQAADKAERTRDQAERAYQGVLGRGES